MPARRRPSTSLSAKTAELALAVPQVVAHRLLRMAHAGPHLSARDRKEFARMVAEKNSAFGESWNAMALQTCSRSAPSPPRWRSPRRRRGRRAPALPPRPSRRNCSRPPSR